MFMQSKNIEYKVMHVYDSYTKQEYLVVILSRAFLRVHLVNFATVVTLNTYYFQTP